MNYDPAMTLERVEALNLVDVRLVGVTHGITEYIDGRPNVRGGHSEDFNYLVAAVDELDPARGDVMAVEPIGFRSAFAKDMTLANILPANIPEGPAAHMSEEVREGVVTFLEKGRHDRYLNSVAYAAAYALLRGVPIRRAEVSRQDWAALKNIITELGPPDVQGEIELFYRNTKMLAQLGDIAIGMGGRGPQEADVSTGGAKKPVLMFASGRTHTVRLGKRFVESRVSFRSNMQS